MRKKEVEKLKDEILDRIDDATRPDKMKWTDAVLFMNDLATDIQGKIDDLKTENEDQDEDEED